MTEDDEKNVQVMELPADAETPEENPDTQQSDITPKTPFKKFVNNKLYLAVAALGVVFVVTVLYASGAFTGMVVANQITPDEAGQKAVDFVNSYLLNDGEMSLVSVEEESGLYKVSTLINGQAVLLHMTMDGKYIIVGSIGILDIEEYIETIETAQSQPQPTTGEEIQRNQPENPEIKTFSDSGEDICFEDGKPVIRMYASSGCGFCTWNKPIFEKVVREYMDDGKIVAYLWENGKNILSDEQESMSQEEELLRQKYGFTGVPAFVFGCKYYRGGASYSRVENGEMLEEIELRAVIEDLLTS